MSLHLDLAPYRRIAQDLVPVRRQGRVLQVIGLTIEAEGLSPHLGEICHIYTRAGSSRISAEVVGFREGRFVLMPFGDVQGLTPDSVVFSSGRHFTVPVGNELMGRVVDGFARPIDDKGPLGCAQERNLGGLPPSPLKRSRITQPISTGVQAIDGLLTCGQGQRIGLFSGSGVGKSTLMGMVARHARADVSVIALIGERGREVQDFLQNDLGEAGLRRAVVVVSTSDQPALLRLKGAWVATTIAEHFRDQGLNVLFMMDSVTRFAMAQREIGLAAGEPPTTRGYPPSVFSVLPKLMERTGTSETGTITGFYTVLMEADDPSEPIADTVRSILDGHIYLSRDLANENHYPAIDVLASISRLMPQITTEAHQRAAGQFRSLLAVYRNLRDLLNLGAYVPGTNPDLDSALALLPAMNDYLRQPPGERTTLEDAHRRLTALFADRDTSDA